MTDEERIEKLLKKRSLERFLSELKPRSAYRLANRIRYAKIMKKS